MNWIRPGKIDIACGHDIYIDILLHIIILFAKKHLLMPYDMHAKALT